MNSFAAHPNEWISHLLFNGTKISLSTLANAFFCSALLCYEYRSNLNRVERKLRICINWFIRKMCFLSSATQNRRLTQFPPSITNSSESERHEPHYFVGWCCCFTIIICFKIVIIIINIASVEKSVQFHLSVRMCLIVVLVKIALAHKYLSLSLIDHWAPPALRWSSAAGSRAVVFGRLGEKCIDLVCGIKRVCVVCV